MNVAVDYAQPHRLTSSAVGFATPVRLLEFNRPAHSPWLTVPLAQEEIAIQAYYDAVIFGHGEYEVRV